MLYYVTAKLAKMKAHLREAEEELVKVLAGVALAIFNLHFSWSLNLYQFVMNWKAEILQVFKWFLNVFEICGCIAKTRKDAKQMATRNSISAIKTRVGELKRTVQVKRVRREEYEAIISQQSLGNYLSLHHG